MKGDLPSACLRLMASLPVREHRQARPPEQRDLGARHWNAGRKPIAGRKPKRITGRGRGGLNRRAIRVGARHFDSVRHALKDLGIGKRTIAAMLADGRAAYLKGSK